MFPLSIEVHVSCVMSVLFLHVRYNCPIHSPYRGTVPFKNMIGPSLLRNDEKLTQNGSEI